MMVTKILANRWLAGTLGLLLGASSWGAPPTGGVIKAEQAAKKSAPTTQPATPQTAILAGGCFWGMEELFRKVPGVLTTEVGYAGGKAAGPSYSDVSSGSTGHAESLKLTYDPKVLSYEDLLKLYFRAHDPTSLNRQGNDVGTQYRSAIFYLTPEQKMAAEQVKAKVEQSHKWGKPVVTEITAGSPFYPAESYHQKYLVKNPNGYNDHYLRDFKFD